MAKFPVDAPIRQVIQALERLGFQLLREGNHISMVRENADGTRTPLTLPNHRRIKGFDFTASSLTVRHLPERIFESLSGVEAKQIRVDLRMDKVTIWDDSLNE